MRKKSSFSEPFDSRFSPSLLFCTAECPQRSKDRAIVTQTLQRTKVSPNKKRGNRVNADLSFVHTTYWYGISLHLTFAMTWFLCFLDVAPSLPGEAFLFPKKPKRNVGWYALGIAAAMENEAHSREHTRFQCCTSCCQLASIIVRTTPMRLLRKSLKLADNWVLSGPYY